MKRPPIDDGNLLGVSMENTIWLMKWCRHLEDEIVELRKACKRGLERIESCNINSPRTIEIMQTAINKSKEKRLDK